MFSICSKIIGSKDNLNFGLDKTISWGPCVDSQVLISCDNNVIRDFFNVYDFKISSVFDRKYEKSMEDFDISEVPWRYVVPREEWFSSIKGYVGSISKLLESSNSTGYYNFFMESNEIITSLTKACDKKIVNLKNQPEVLKTFIKKHQSEEITYSRSSTKTGRLNIVKGPNILTLKKEWRTLLHPKTKKNLISIDLVSCEPRTLMLTQGLKPSKDVYLSIVKELGLSKTDRSKVKIYTLASMYSKDHNTSGNKLKKEITKYFNLKSFKSNLIDSMDDGIIYNKFGRPIVVKEKEINNVINYYIQSTSADASLMCFSKILKNYDIIPCYIIHDELICEASDEVVKDLRSQKSIDILGLGNYYYDVKIINKKGLI